MNKAIENYECEGQMSIDDFIKPELDLTYDRTGQKTEAPKWMKRERCENCKYWELLPVEEQSPWGWGVKGQCNLYHEGQKCYQTPSSISYCQEFKFKS